MGFSDVHICYEDSLVLASDSISTIAKAYHRVCAGHEAR